MLTQIEARTARLQPLTAATAATPAAPTQTAPCAICGQPVSRWLPHPQADRRSPFMVLMQAVGSDLSVYLCPHCGCNDRDRHLWLYLQAAGIADRLPGARVLHLAPEIRVEPLIERRAPALYLRGDLYPSRPGQQRVDVEAMSFADASFDLVICNHILEHVSDVARALGELRRVLARGGTLVAQTPYAPMLARTMELTVKPVPRDVAALFFGQDDHVRLFGADIADVIRAAGFDGGLRPHEELLGAFDARAWGCNGREPFFAFTRRD